MAQIRTQFKKKSVKLTDNKILDRLKNLPYTVLLHDKTRS